MYMANIMNYPVVWVDETIPASLQSINALWLGVTAIAVLSVEGLVAHEILSGTTNGDWLAQSFPAPQSVLILDNCSVHHV